MSLPIVEGLADRRLNRWRYSEIRLAYLQMDDIDALALHGSRSLQDLHDYKRGDLFGSFGDHFLFS